MALAIDVINRRGPNNEMHRHLQPKKTKVMLLQYYPCIQQQKTIYLPFITSKWMCYTGGK